MLAGARLVPQHHDMMKLSAKLHGVREFTQHNVQLAGVISDTWSRGCELMTLACLQGGEPTKTTLLK